MKRIAYSTKKSRAERAARSMATIRQECWPSELTWYWLTDAERRLVRNKRLILNVLEPNWRPPRD